VGNPDSRAPLVGAVMLMAMSVALYPQVSTGPDLHTGPVSAAPGAGADNELDVTVTYYCIGQVYGCIRPYWMASEVWPFVGAAACSPDLPMGTLFVFPDRADGIEYWCLDTGSAVRWRHADLFSGVNAPVWSRTRERIQLTGWRGWCRFQHRGACPPPPVPVPATEPDAPPAPPAEYYLE